MPAKKRTFQSLEIKKPGDSIARLRRRFWKMHGFYVASCSRKELAKNVR
jgi:hypothetical protein